MFNQLFYTIGQGIRNIFRNKMFSIASVATMSACIFMFGIFFTIVTNVNAMVKEAEEGVAITVFFKEDTDAAEIEAFGNTIAERSEVSAINYVSAEDAWESFKEEYFEGNEELSEAFAGDNPLANSANFEIYLSDVSGQDDLVDYINTFDCVRSVKESEAVAKILTDVNKLISYVSVAIILILLMVAVFLISTTVTIGISVRRGEIAIMKLIGATDLFVRAPFMVEGVVIGAIGAAIPLVAVFFLYERICAYIAEMFSFFGSTLSFVNVYEVFHTLTPVAMGLGVGIGFLGSLFTVRKHLKV